MTSAFHAVSWDPSQGGHTFTEADCTLLDGPGVDAYGMGKTLVERAAWEFITRESGELELVTLLPVAVMRPVMLREISGVSHIVQRRLNGEMPAPPA